MKWLALGLAGFLVISNAFWVFQFVGGTEALMEKDQHIYSVESTGKQLMELLPKLAGQAGKEEILSAAATTTERKAYARNGCTWVGWLGFKFAVDDRLEAVAPTWSLKEGDPCYPGP